MRRKLVISFILIVMTIFTACGKDDNKDMQEELESHVISIERINEGTEAAKYVTTWKIIYSSDEEQVAGYVAVPNDMVNDGEKHSCIIYNRGGNQTYGMLESDTVSSYAYTFQTIVFASQYRGVDGGTGKDEYGGADIEDVNALVDICCDVSFIDTDNLYMLGSSRGGIMTYEFLRDDDRIKKAAVVSGVADLNASCKERSDMAELCKELIGGTPEELPEEYTNRSAVCWAEDIDTPLLLIHSTHDNKVSYKQTFMLNKELEDANKTVKLITRDDDIHGFENSDIELIKDWFK